jgi:Flp pilus assembly protein TadG
LRGRSTLSPYPDLRDTLGVKDKAQKRRGGFGHNKSGLTAPEFVLILPVLISMLFGIDELSLTVFCRTDIAQIASTVSDLIAQETTVTSGDVGNVYATANTIPYPHHPIISSFTPAWQHQSFIEGE